MKTEKLRSIIESVLLASGEPVKIGKLAKITSCSRSEIEAAMDVLSSEYSSGRGFILLRKEDEVQLASNPENSQYISELIKSDVQEGLTQSALEVLSVVAYRGPITRAGVEAIRGVNSSFTVRALLMRGLLERVENPADSRSYLYKISFDFLKKLGMDSVEKLPDFESLSVDERAEEITNFNQK